MARPGRRGTDQGRTKTSGNYYHLVAEARREKERDMAFIRGVLGALVGQVFAGSAGARAFVVGVATGIWVGQNYDVPNVKQEFQR